MRILHIAPFNTAGVPYTFVQAEIDLGHESRLITLGRNRQEREEDICLELPFLDSWVVRSIKRFVTPSQRREIRHIARIPEKIPLIWKPNGWIERSLFKFRETIWKSKVDRAIREFGLKEFDVYQLDGGLGFYRDGRVMQGLQKCGKKIICCYTGSDLRTRGVIPSIDALSDLNVTVEFDHLQYHPNIHHIPFPLGIFHFEMNNASDEGPVRIGHAPTSRAAKGSDIIIPIVRALENVYPAKLVLIEGMSYQNAIELKRSCHIFIDQIGDLGYGINSLESLAMAIPTCSSLAPGFHEAYPEHPFIEVSASSLKDQLIRLIENADLRGRLGKKGQTWVQRVHDAKSVVNKVHHLAGLS